MPSAWRMPWADRSPPITLVAGEGDPRLRPRRGRLDPPTMSVVSRSLPAEAEAEARISRLPVAFAASRGAVGTATGQKKEGGWGSLVPPIGRETSHCLRAGVSRLIKNASELFAVTFAVFTTVRSVPLGHRRNYSQERLAKENNFSGNAATGGMPVTGGAKRGFRSGPLPPFQGGLIVTTNQRVSTTPHPCTPFITAEELANYLGVSARTIRRLVLAGTFPKPVRLGGSVRWLRPTIDQWVRTGCGKCSR